MSQSDLILTEVARTQHGLFTRAQAIEAGLPSRTISRRVTEGRWERVGRDVFCTNGVPVSFRRAVMAAVLSIEGAIGSHESAATLQSFRYLDARPIAISVPPHAWHRLSGVKVHRYADLLPEHISTVHGIPVTNAERTMIDLGAVLHPKRLEVILDAALAAKQVDRALLLRTFNQVARRGRRGAGRIRPLLAARGDGYVAPDSELERRFLRFVEKFGIPEPSRQVPTFYDDRLIGLIDFTYPQAKLIVEVDGRLGHTQLLDFENDRVHDERAVAAKWRVMRVTWNRLKREPDDLADSLRDALSVDSGPRTA